MISPTGQGIRHDPMGHGHYGAARGDKYHKGTDYLCDVGQKVVSPITGTVIREARPYAEGDLSGLVIRNKGMEVKLFYLNPLSSMIGKCVEAGDVIGIAQDVSELHGHNMFPHIHLEIVSINPDIFVNDFTMRQ